jgi:hypothetical protein
MWLLVGLNSDESRQYMRNLRDVVISPYNVQECEILLLENDVTRSRHVEAYVRLLRCATWGM